MSPKGERKAYKMAGAFQGPRIYTGWGFRGTWRGDPAQRPSEEPIPLDQVPESRPWHQVRRQIFGEAFSREGGRCYWCGRQVHTHERRAPWHPLRPDHATLDHLLPQSKGGLDTLSNVVLACNACNHERGDMSAKAFASRRRRSHPHNAARLPNDPIASLRAAAAEARRAETQSGSVHEGAAPQGGETPNNSPINSS